MTYKTGAVALLKRGFELSDIMSVLLMTGAGSSGIVGVLGVKIGV